VISRSGEPEVDREKFQHPHLMIRILEIRSDMISPNRGASVTMSYNGCGSGCKPIHMGCGGTVHPSPDSDNTGVETRQHPVQVGASIHISLARVSVLPPLKPTERERKGSPVEGGSVGMASENASVDSTPRGKVQKSSNIQSLSEWYKLTGSIKVCCDGIVAGQTQRSRSRRVDDHSRCSIESAD
jgi:hypothetical protein